jgi:hypothetical protein
MHTQQRTKQVSESTCVTLICWAIRVWLDKRISEHHLRPWCRGQPWRRRAPGRRLYDLRGRPTWVQTIPATCALKIDTTHRPWHSLGASRSLAYSFSVIIAIIALATQKNAINLETRITLNLAILIILITLKSPADKPKPSKSKPHKSLLQTANNLNYPNTPQ